MSQVKPSTIGTAVVTGASSGIGKVYADRLAARGYDLLLVARRGDRLQTIAADLQARFPINVSVLVVDLAQPAGLSEAMQKLSSNPAITLLVNNAGVANVEPLAQVSLDTITNLVALNVTALTALTSAVLPNFLARDSWMIINIGSVVGFAGYPWVPVYGGTKAYVLSFTQGLKLQLAETAIR